MVFTALVCPLHYPARPKNSSPYPRIALKADDIEALKTKFGFNPSEKFVVPKETYDAYNEIAKKGADTEAKWNSLLKSYGDKYPKEHAELSRRIAGELPENWESTLPVYKTSDAAKASRALSETVLTSISAVLPELIGGSADLTGSNLTKVKGSVDFQPPSTKLGDYSGTYIRYGVREHAMGAIANGLHAYGGIIPFVGTFLVSFTRGVSGPYSHLCSRTLSRTLPVPSVSLPSAHTRSSGSVSIHPPFYEHCRF